MKKTIIIGIVLVILQTACKTEKKIYPTFTLQSIYTNTFSTTPTPTSTLSLIYTKILTNTPIFTRTFTHSPTITIDYSRTVTNRIKLIYYFDRYGPYGDDIPENLEWSYLDLDTLTLGKTPQSDLHYSTSLGSMFWYWLNAINDAKEWTKGNIDIGLKDCYNKSIPNEDYESRTYEGNHMCVVSNRNRLFLVYIDRLNAQFPIEPHSYATIYMNVTTYV
jgi:hypothetical protein